MMNAAFSYHNGVVICVQHYAKAIKVSFDTSRCILGQYCFRDVYSMQNRLRIIKHIQIQTICYSKHVAVYSMYTAIMCYPMGG
ncbi:hypothetical protein APHDU1_1520 [Anaplasma phagocytophilum]|nr:hypothetical protein APHDU1_1520 [Anaplasma phagocytophilum]